MTRQRRRFTSEEKAAIVRRHLVDKVPLSDLCDELGLHPTQIYTWQKQLFENAALLRQQEALDQECERGIPEAPQETTLRANRKEARSGDHQSHLRHTPDGRQVDSWAQSVPCWQSHGKDY